MTTHERHSHFLIGPDGQTVDLLAQGHVVPWFVEVEEDILDAAFHDSSAGMNSGISTTSFGGFAHWDRALGLTP